MPATIAKPRQLTNRSAIGIKKTLSQAMRQEMAARRISINEMAKVLGTGRTSVRRILDEENTSITLETMSRVAGALGLEVALTTRKLSPAELGRLAGQLPSANKAKASALKKQILAGFYA
jgi:transcriptional regulator with XRE-family HTH domain